MQHEAHAVKLHERSLVKNVAGLRLSVDLHEGGVQEDNDEEKMCAHRRERLMRNVKTAGLENYTKARASYVPEWRKPPELRKSADAKMLREVVEIEESWDDDKL